MRSNQQTRSLQRLEAKYGKKFIIEDYREISKERILAQDRENRLKFRKHRETIYGLLSFFLLATLYFAKWYLDQ